MYLFSGWLIRKWKNYYGGKSFDNIISVITDNDFFYILNGNKIIGLTMNGEFIFEYISQYPLIK
jgi:hypothetical protein